MCMKFTFFVKFADIRFSVRPRSYQIRLPNYVVATLLTSVETGFRTKVKDGSANAIYATYHELHANCRFEWRCPQIIIKVRKAVQDSFLYFISRLLHVIYTIIVTRSASIMNEHTVHPCSLEHGSCFVAFCYGLLLDNVNSLAPGRFEFKFRLVIFKPILVNDGWGISYEITLRWMPQDLTDDEATLVQVMACCRQATSHYLRQCWPRFMSPNGVTKPQ